MGAVYNRLEPRSFRWWNSVGAASAVITKSEPKLMWLPIVGLDRHTPMIGLQPQSGLVLSRLSIYGRVKGIQDAIYQPISDFAYSGMME